MRLFHPARVLRSFERPRGNDHACRYSRGGTQAQAPRLAARWALFRARQVPASARQHPAPPQTCTSAMLCLTAKASSLHAPQLLQCYTLAPDQLVRPHQALDTARTRAAAMLSCAFLTRVGQSGHQMSRRPQARRHTTARANRRAPPQPPAPWPRSCGASIKPDSRRRRRVRRARSLRARRRSCRPPCGAR